MVPGYLKNNNIIIATIVISIVAIYLFVTRKVKVVSGDTKISSYYGWRKNPFTGDDQFHNGIDISAKSGNIIRSILPGKVEAVGYDGINGHYIKIKHNNYGSFYGHMLKSSGLKKGQFVAKGQKIGLVGSTGASTGPHVHFIVYDQNWQHINPIETNLFRL